MIYRFINTIYPQFKYGWLAREGVNVVIIGKSHVKLLLNA